MCSKATQKSVVLKTLQSEYALYTIQLQSITLHGTLSPSSHYSVNEVVVSFSQINHRKTFAWVEFLSRYLHH